ncbi:MAG: FAD-dependent oxidoreductase, partial [Candidatus Korarchaeum sp.]
SNARFISLVCNDRDDHFELIYYFDRGGSGILGVKTRVKKGEKAQSITSVYPCVFLAENEVKDMFKLEFIGLSPDVGGVLLRTSETESLLKPAVGERPPLFRTPARCFLTCPANTDIPRYLRQIAEGRFEEALETNLEVNPLPATLGRVCFAPCETACRRAKNGDPLQIRALKRFAADTVGIYPRNVRRKESTGKRVAVIGAGPAGVAAAYYLGLLGHQVVVFDELPRPGGMLLVGIPKYRLPKDILFAEIEARFKEAGVEFRPNMRIENLDELFAQGFNAIFIATGAHKGAKLGIEGEEHPRVIEVLDLLREVNLHDKRPSLGDKVIVIGGGNSAMDAARVSLRLGAKEVWVCYRRTRQEMPASPSEVEAAEAEGVRFNFLVAPKRIIGDGEGKLKVEFVRMKLGEPDASGRARPEPIPGSEFIMEADTIIKAIGQVVVVPEGFKIETDRRGLIKVDPETLQTNRTGVFAGGDAILGPSSAIEAIATGRKAASSIDRYLGGKGLPEPKLETEFIWRPVPEEVIPLKRINPLELPVEKRINNFDEVEQCLSVEDAEKEALRCWRCDWYE